MKNILKFGLLTRFVMLFLFIFGIHAFTPTVALADTLAVGLEFQCENGAIAKKADGSDAEFIANEYTSDDLTQKFICNGKYVNTWDNSYEPTVGAITNNDLWSLITYAASSTSHINFTSVSYGDYATIKITLNNQSATTAGTTEYYYKFNTYNGSCYYFSNSALTTCLPDATDGTKIKIPTRTGYTFGGYYTGKNGEGTQYVDPDGKTVNNIYKAVGTPTTLYAKWTRDIYTITLDGNGATKAAIPSQWYVPYSTGVVCATKTCASSAEYVNITKNPITKPELKYTVTFARNDGTGTTTSASAYATFKGFYTSKTSQSSLTQMIADTGYITSSGNSAAAKYTSNKTWYAGWTNDGTVKLPTPTRAGHTFNGWYTSATNGTKVGDAGDSYTVSSNITLYAKWTKNPYSVGLGYGNGCNYIQECKTNESCPLLSKFQTRTYCKDIPAGQEVVGWQLLDSDYNILKEFALEADIQSYLASNVTTDTYYDIYPILGEAQKYTITLHAPGCDEDGTTVQYYDGQIMNLPEQLTNCDICGGEVHYWYAQDLEYCKTHECGSIDPGAAYNNMNNGTDFYALVIDHPVYCEPGTYLKAGKSGGTEHNCSPCKDDHYCPGTSTEPLYCRMDADQGIFECPQGYSFAKETSDSAGASSSAECYIEVDSGYYVKNATDKTQTICPAGYYCYLPFDNKVYYGNASAAPKKCEPGYYCPQRSESQKQCYAGAYCDGTGLTTYTVCTGNTYTATTKQTSCTECPSGYAISGTNLENHDNPNDCKITCPAGQYVATSGTVCTNVGNGKYSLTHTVANGSITSTNYFFTCPDGGVTGKENATAITDCYITKACTVSGGTGTTKCTYSTNKEEYVCSGTCDMTQCDPGWEPIDGKCERKDYTVTLNANGGNGTSSVVVTFENAMPPIVTIPTRVGYNFMGYYDTSATTGGTQYYTSSGTSAHNWDKPSSATLYARWQAKEYYITYHANNVTIGSIQPCTYGQKCTIGEKSNIADLAAGNSFDGTWQTEDCSERVLENNKNLHEDYPKCEEQLAEKGNVSFIAKTTINTYVIKYDANGGGYHTGDSNTQISNTTGCSYGKPCTLTSDYYIKSGYSFLGWSENKNADNATYEKGETLETGNPAWGDTKDETITLYAIYGKCNPCQNNEGVECTLNTANGTCSYETYCETGYGNIQNENQYNATCTKNTYTIKFYFTETDKNPAQTETVTHGDSLWLKSPYMPTRKGHNFVGLFNQKEGTYYNSNYDRVISNPTVEGNLELFAKWEANTVEITLNSNTEDDYRGTAAIFYAYETQGEDGCVYFKDPDLTECFTNDTIDTPTKPLYDFVSYTDPEENDEEYVNRSGNISRSLYTTRPNNTTFNANYVAVCTPVKLFVADGDTELREAYVYMYPDSTTVYSDKDCNVSITELPPSMRAGMSNADFNGFYNRDGEMCVDTNWEFTGDCQLQYEDEYWDQQFKCHTGYWSYGNDGSITYPSDPCTPLCYEIELTYATDSNTEDYAYYYMKHGDDSTFYTSPYCEESTKTWIDQDHFGRMSYINNFVGFVDEDDELCFLPDGRLTGNCEVSSNDTYWTAKYECSSGYQGAGQYVIAGEACLPDCIEIELGYSENGDGGESYYYYYMKPGEYGYLYDGNCYTTKDRLDTVETEYFGYDNHGTFVGFYMHDDNSDKIVQCTDSNGQILGDCKNTVKNNGTWWARYRCDTGYTANGDVIEAGDYEPCSNCYELGIIPSADYINTDVVYIQNNSSLYIDSVCQNSVQGDALEPKETPANAKFLGYTNMELPDVSYTGELADDFLCTSSDMNYQLGLTGNCTVSDNDQVWTAVYECAEGYRANGKFVDYDTPCSASVYSVGIVYSCGEYAGGEAPERPKRCSSNDDCIMPSADACGVYPGHTFKEWEIKLKSGNKITVPADENVQSYINAGETGGSWSVTAQWTTDTVYTIEYYCSIDDFSKDVKMSQQCYVGQDDCVNFVDPGCENDDYSYSNLYFEVDTTIKFAGTARTDTPSLGDVLAGMADKDYNKNGITTVKVRPNWVASVTLNNQGADLGNGTEVFYVIDGKVYANSEDTTQTLSKIELPKKTGNSFIGYYEETNCVGDQVVNSNGKIDTAYFADNKGNMVLHACWNPDWREIWYYTNPDNDLQIDTYVQYGTEITIGKGWKTTDATEEKVVEIGERPGYTFTGWITEEGIEYKNGAKYIVKHTGVLELYATWTKNDYTIKYYDEGNLINTTKYTVDNVGMSLYEPDAKEGYIFLGWNTQPDCESTYIYSITENNLDNYDLYACWQTGEYTLTYELNGGEWAEGSNVTNNKVVYTVEDLPMGLAVPAERKGYTFNGWYNNVDCEGTAISKIEEAENITLYAKWDLTDYAITYILNGGTNNPENPETYTIKERVVLKDPTYNGNGKLFHKWSDTEDCSGGAITALYGSDAVDKTLYACWKDVIISIKYLCDGTNQIGETQKCSAFAEECTLNANICDGTVKGNYYNSYDIVGIDGSFKKDVDLVMEGFINHLLADDNFWEADKPTLKLTPVWEPYIYGITLNNGEGVSNATIYSKYGVDKFYTNAQCNQTLPSNKVDIPNKDNYNFAGYSVDANSCENDRVVIDYKGAIDTEKLKTYADETYVSDNPVELYACWRPVSFEVYYNLNDTNNSGTYRNTVVAYNTEVQIGTIIRPDDGISETLKPEFVGHEFMGWSTERNGNPDNTYEQGALYTIKENTTFYAQWKVMTFTCKSGEYLDVKACEQCPKGYKCPQTQFTYDNNVQGRIACSGATEYQDQAGQTTCKTVSDGYYKTADNTQQIVCGNGYYCKNAVRTVCPDNGLTDTATATDVTDCYKNNQSCTINGGVGMSDVCHYDTTKSGYKNCDVCIINGCNSGYYKDNNTCTICPQGSYCANSDKNACPDKYTTAGTGATQQSDCFTTCDDISVEYGIAHADNATVKAPAGCTYSRGESVTGNPCDIKNDKCVETSCKYNYEMKGGKCAKCVRDNARSFKQGNGNCVVESCEFGYYPYGQSCVPATKECTTSSVYAIAAQKTWDTKTNSYTVCQITECADGYHISDNSCISDEKTCYVANGSGIQTWNHSLNRWNDECVVTQCNAGYTNDPSLTNETSVHCGRCTNAYDMNGDEAASLYIHGCEIATCKDQGKKYILENNECRTICDSKSDETGTRYWNGKECVHECNAGYLEW